MVIKLFRPHTSLRILGLHPRKKWTYSEIVIEFWNFYIRGMNSPKHLAHIIVEILSLSPFYWPKIISIYCLLCARTLHALSFLTTTLQERHIPYFTFKEIGTHWNEVCPQNLTTNSLQIAEKALCACSIINPYL